jgi:cardiolipin synthase A/B
VRVRLIVNASFDSEEEDVLISLASAGVDVRLMEGLYIHAKTMIVDGATALIGSQNYTPTSLDQNRELGMVVEQGALVNRCLAIFERDWVRAIPAAPVRDEVPLGAAPIRGYDIGASDTTPAHLQELVRPGT